jgi:hypothetical protein
MSAPTMSAPTIPDIFEKVWKDFTKDKPTSENGITVPRPQGHPKISISSLPFPGKHLEGCTLTWGTERVLSEWRYRNPEVINGILKDFMEDDTVVQLEKIYQHELACTELEEYWKVRLERAIGQWEGWKHVAAKASDDLAAAKEGREKVAVAMQYAVLDRAQGRIIHWAKVVAQEEKRCQRQETRLRKLARPAIEAIELLEKRPDTKVGWHMLAYSVHREDASVLVSELTSHLPLSSRYADNRSSRRVPRMSEDG